MTEPSSYRFLQAHFCSVAIWPVTYAAYNEIISQIFLFSRCLGIAVKEQLRQILDLILPDFQSCEEFLARMAEVFQQLWLISAVWIQSLLLYTSDLLPIYFTATYRTIDNEDIARVKLKCLIDHTIIVSVKTVSGLK